MVLIRNGVMTDSVIRKNAGMIKVVGVVVGVWCSCRGNNSVGWGGIRKLRFNVCTMARK